MKTQDQGPYREDPQPYREDPGPKTLQRETRTQDPMKTHGTGPYLEDPRLNEDQLINFALIYWL